MASPAPSPVSRWEELFDELSELPPPARARRLAALETEDPALAARLARLLEADGETTDFPGRPAVELLDAAGESAAEPSLPAGTRVGSWRLLGLLGRGGMGEVYLAERDEGTFLQRAALKLIKRGMDSRAIVRRFVRERRRRPAVLRAGAGGRGADHRVLRCQSARPGGAAAALPGRLRGGRQRPPPPGGAPRSQAGQHPGRRRRRRQAARLRHRQAAGRRRGGGDLPAHPARRPPPHPR